MSDVYNMREDYKGQCLCGEVHIAIKGNISDIIHCHCSLCRKNSGTAYATNGFINADEFEITQGKNSLSSFFIQTRALSSLL